MKTSELSNILTGMYMATADSPVQVAVDMWDQRSGLMKTYLMDIKDIRFSYRENSVMICVNKDEGAHELNKNA